MQLNRLTGGQALVCGIATHCIWGTLPLYLLLVDDVPPLEFVAWRTLFTLPICAALVLLLKERHQLFVVLQQPRALATLLATSALIGLNWWLYVWAIQQGMIYAASLGYFILPLLMVALGGLVLGERTSTAQKLAIALAALGVGVLSAGADATLWVSLGLAATFGLYGLLRKTVAAGPLVGLTIEATILLPVVGGYLLWLSQEAGLSFGRDTLESGAILGAGFVTAIPLLLFAAAARTLSYTAMGMLQFMAPSMIFLLGLFVFREELRPQQIVCFALIWTGIAIFAWDIAARDRRERGRRQRAAA